ncbi:MAG: HD domain-containing protein [Lachnospiraceae bacterium]|nr:HD domain-containing protein [Lachnospiraceae bacterium]
MRFLDTLNDGESVQEIYFVKTKTSAMTKNGKPYDNLTVQDKTGTMEAKIWTPNSAGIDDFDALDYVEITASVQTFNGAKQLNVSRVRKCVEGEYDQAYYMPVSSKNIDAMYADLIKLIKSVKTVYFRMLLEDFFEKDEEFIKKFKKSSAAKTVHHSYIGGLLEHTLSVANMCNYIASAYEMINRDLLLSAAILHDIAKVKEFSEFPMNDYTDDGQLLGHIVMGYEMVSERIVNIPGFPEKSAAELKHCILSHHGELEFGSPKKPALIEAVALSFADNTDAKLETFKEDINKPSENEWRYSRFIESNIRKTTQS